MISFSTIFCISTVCPFKSALHSICQSRFNTYYLCCVCAVLLLICMSYEFTRFILQPLSTASRMYRKLYNISYVIFVFLFLFSILSPLQSNWGSFYHSVIFEFIPIPTKVQAILSGQLYLLDTISLACSLSQCSTCLDVGLTLATITIVCHNRIICISKKNNQNYHNPSNGIIKFMWTDLAIGNSWK